MDKGVFIQKMNEMRPHLSKEKVAREVGCAKITVFDYMKGFCPNPIMRQKIHDAAKMQIEEKYAQLREICNSCV